MTVAVIWQEESFLWAVADTRFNRVGINGDQLITDHGPKILPLPVVVRQPADNGFFHHVKFQTTFGLLYAGASNPALSAHALSVAVLQNLIIHPEGAHPSLQQIADFVRKVSERYMRDWGQLSPANACFEAIVFGWCAIDREFQAYLIAPRIEELLVVHLEKLELSEPNAIGSGAVDFKAQLKELRRDGDSYGRTARLPLLAIESLVASRARPDVGGDVQIAYANQIGVQIMTRTRPLVPGQPIARTTFLGIDTNELGSIGTCKIGMNSLA